MKTFLWGLIYFIWVITPSNLQAQHQDLTEKPKMWKGRVKLPHDTGVITRAFQSGTFQGHFRYFYMNTQNSGSLSDYFAHAGGGGIRYETAPFFGLQFAVSGFYIFNLQSNNLGLTDSLANASNRYELGLFDVQNPSNREDLDRLEEFYLKYHFGQSHLTFGRQLINTPFLNLQDGRMRPTGVNGIWMHILEIPKWKIEGGYLWSITPRSTVKWYSIGESIGVYGQGVDIDGKKARFLGKLNSEYLAMIGAHRDWGKHRIQFWNLHADRLFNSTLFMGDFEFPFFGGSFLAGVQAIKQYGIGNGGNDSVGLRYIDPKGSSSVFSSRLAWKDKQQDIGLAYTRISKEGRYLMPREWGRDPFYTFMPRERNEGLGDVHAIVAKYQRKLPIKNTQSSLAVGHFKLPSVRNYTLNKYGFPSYIQANIDLRHQFGGMWQGLEGQLLIAHKWNISDENLEARHTFNKVDMTNVNVVLNYYF